MISWFLPTSAFPSSYHWHYCLVVACFFSTSWAGAPSWAAGCWLLGAACRRLLYSIQVTIQLCKTLSQIVDQDSSLWKVERSTQIRAILLCTRTVLLYYYFLVYIAVRETLYLKYTSYARRHLKEAKELGWQAAWWATAAWRHRYFINYSSHRDSCLIIFYTSI